MMGGREEILVGDCNYGFPNLQDWKRWWMPW